MTAPRVSPDDFELVVLVARAQDGDVASFSLVVEQFQAPLFRYCLRMLHDRGDAEDLTQDTLVAAWRQLPGLADPQAFVAWLYRIASRLCLNAIRSRERRPAVPVEPEHLRAASPPTRAPEAQAELAAELAELERLVRLLPEELRMCWVLREYHQLSYAEIALAVSATESTVRGRIARARQRLAEGMASWR